MGFEKLTAISNNDKAVNVGSSLRIQHQDASIGSNAQSVHTGYECRDITVINNKITHHHHSKSELPVRTTLAAAYVHKHLVSPEDDAQWSNPSQGFVTQIEGENECAEIEYKWQQTMPSVKRLKGEISKFSNGSEDRSWSIIEHSFQDELHKAIDMYSGQSLKKQSPVYDHLKTIKKYMAKFSFWLKALKTDQHRSLLFAAMQCILTAVTEQERSSTYASETVADVFRLFGDGTESYLSTIKSEKLFSSLIEDTIAIFECLVDILVFLLRGVRKNESFQTEEITKSLGYMEERLCSAHNTANKPPTRQTRSNSDHHGSAVLVRNFYVFLCSCENSFEYFHLQPRQMYLQHRPLVQTDKSVAQIDKSYLTPSEVIDYLNYSASPLTKAIKKYITVGKSNLKDINELARFTHGKVYRAWLMEESKSSALLVEGGRDPNEPTSFLSYLCARIVQEYKDVDRIFVLSYFGNSHGKKRGQRANAADVLRQMLGQLLTYERIASFYPCTPIGQELIKMIKRNDFETLLDIFLKLIKELESYKSVIFCLIDSVTMIESGKKKENAANLLRALNGIVNGQRGKRRSPNTRMIFKLLVTEKATCLTADGVFDSQDRVNLSHGLSDGSIHRDILMKLSRK